MKKKRKQYTPQEKVMILRKHLVEKETVSDLCDEYELQPTVFYRWQKAFFENGTQAFERGGDRQTRQLKGQIAELETKLAKKNEVLGEVMEEMVALKKGVGPVEGEMGRARGPGSGGRVCAVLVGASGDGRQAVGQLGRDQSEQILRVAAVVRSSQ